MIQHHIIAESSRKMRLMNDDRSCSLLNGLGNDIAVNRIQRAKINNFTTNSLLLGLFSCFLRNCSHSSPSNECDIRTFTH